MSSGEKKARLFYHRLPEFWRKENKLDFLSDNALNTVDWQRLIPNTKHTWRRTDTEDEFDSFIPIGSKEAKRAKPDQAETIFKTYTPGVTTGRDSWVYDFNRNSLNQRTQKLVSLYNQEVYRYRTQVNPPPIDDFVDYSEVKWGETLKKYVVQGRTATHNVARLRNSLYRPFAKKRLYYESMLIERTREFAAFLPDENSEAENRIICCTDVAYRSPSVSCLIVDSIPNLSVLSTTDGHQCFPFYTYDEDGSNRRENITDYALAQFRRHYSDTRISKWDIFYYVYGILHHPGYRERYVLDLKRNLPRIPFAPLATKSPPANDAVGATHRVARDGQAGGFWLFSQAGVQLAELHLNYESADRYELEWQPTRKPVSYRVEKMLPKGKVESSEGSYKVYSTLKYNDTLTLHGIPERAFAYRLGNRSALDWIVDQYRVKTDKRSGITHDPNGYSDDPKYILHLIERVISVSLRTVDIVEALARLPFRPETAD